MKLNVFLRALSLTAISAVLSSVQALSVYLKNADRDVMTGHSITHPRLNTT